MPGRLTDKHVSANYCALYMRLSREDDKGVESASIETQRKILRDYARENDFLIYDEYVDDGYTGTSLDRPAFNRMLRDIEAGKINAVLTKDVSRLGRNNGRVSMLLDEYFPRYRVRYISIAEGHDSAQRSAASNILMPVRNFVNELYAADISEKIHAAFDIKRKEGEYIGAFAPYGYRKDPCNKNHLLIDETSAAVVRRIFALARTGRSPSQIATDLNQDGVPTPSQYRYQTHPYLDPDSFRRSGAWQSATVGKLLRNETYLGHTVQGKTHKSSFKVKEVRSQPKEQWIIVRDTHEAIIDGETWAMVRKRMQSRAQKREKGFMNMFSGLAKCADCGKNMSTVSTRKKGARANLNCGGYKLGGRASCTNHTIDYDALYQGVLRALQDQIRLSAEEKEEILEDMMKEARRYDGLETKNLKKMIAAIDGKLERLFDDKYAGMIEGAQFETLYQKYSAEKASLQQKQRAAVEERRVKGDSGEDVSRRETFRTLIDEYTCLQTLPPDLLFHLIHHIDVHQGTYIEGVKHQRIDIWFQFQCEPKTLDLALEREQLP